MCQTMFLKWMQFGIHIYKFLLKYMLGLLLILISKSWGCPLGAGHAFPRQRHMCKGVGGGVIYFCHGFFLCRMPSIDGWQDGWIDEWTGHVMKKASQCNSHVSLFLCTLAFVCATSYGAHGLGSQKVWTIGKNMPLTSHIAWYYF